MGSRLLRGLATVLLTAIAAAGAALPASADEVTPSPRASAASRAPPGAEAPTSAPAAAVPGQVLVTSDGAASAATLARQAGARVVRTFPGQPTLAVVAAPRGGEAGLARRLDARRDLEAAP